MITTEEKAERLLRIAREDFALKPKWGAFYAKYLGALSESRQVFTIAEWSAFRTTPAYTELRRMVAELHKDKPDVDVPRSRMVTVRMPAELHTALFEEAHQLRTSLNKLCVSKLMQAIDPELVPTNSKLAPDA